MQESPKTAAFGNYFLGKPLRILYDLAMLREYYGVWTRI